VGQKPTRVVEKNERYTKRDFTYRTRRVKKRTSVCTHTYTQSLHSRSFSRPQCLRRKRLPGFTPPPQPRSPLRPSARVKGEPTQTHKLCKCFADAHLTFARHRHRRRRRRRRIIIVVGNPLSFSWTCSTSPGEFYLFSFSHLHDGFLLPLPSRFSSRYSRVAYKQLVFIVLLILSSLSLLFVLTSAHSDSRLSADQGRRLRSNDISITSP